MYNNDIFNIALLYDNINTSYFEMYHGGRKWTGDPEIRKSTKGRYEGGNGLYFTNNYLTAKQYSKGGGVVHKVKINKNFKDIKDVYVPLEELVSFVSQVPRLKHKNQIISDLKRNADRRKSDVVCLDVLNNLIVNYEAGSGEVGPLIVNYFIEKGADASLQHQSGDEYWLVVFNTKILLDIKICPANINLDEYMLKID